MKKVLLAVGLAFLVASAPPATLSQDAGCVYGKLAEKDRLAVGRNSLKGAATKTEEDKFGEMLGAAVLKCVEEAGWEEARIEPATQLAAVRMMYDVAAVDLAAQKIDASAVADWFAAQPEKLQTGIFGKGFSDAENEAALESLYSALSEKGLSAADFAANSEMIGVAIGALNQAVRVKAGLPLE